MHETGAHSHRRKVGFVFLERMRRPVARHKMMNSCLSSRGSSGRRILVPAIDRVNVAFDACINKRRIIFVQNCLSAGDRARGAENMFIPADGKEARPRLSLPVKEEFAHVALAADRQVPVLGPEFLAKYFVCCCPRYGRSQSRGKENKTQTTGPSRPGIRAKTGSGCSLRDA